MQIKELNTKLKEVLNTFNENSDIITVEEMKQLYHLLNKVLKAAASATKDGDFTAAQFDEIKKAIYLIDDHYGYEE